MSEAIIKRLREARMWWLELEPGKRVRLIRPSEVEVAQHLFQDGKLAVGIDAVKRFSVDWDGFTEADLLGAAIGSVDPLPFEAALWAEVVADRSEWVSKVASAILEAAVRHHAEKAEAEKN